jgi:hypothetical protein
MSTTCQNINCRIKKAKNGGKRILRYETFPHSMSVQGHRRLEKHKDLSSRVIIRIATATLIIQRIFQIYEGKIYVSSFLNFKIENKVLNKIGVGDLILGVLTFL